MISVVIILLWVEALILTVLKSLFSNYITLIAATTSHLNGELPLSLSLVLHLRCEE